MESILVATPLFAAAGYSLIYLLGGGGLFGAFRHLRDRENGGPLIAVQSRRELTPPFQYRSLLLCRRTSHVRKS